MPELALRRTGEMLEVTFEGHQVAVPLSDIPPNETAESSIYDVAVAYGKHLFQKVFPDESLREALTSLRLNERLVLVIDDPSVAATPWEYLRDEKGRLLSARLTLVRSISEAQQYEDFKFTRPLHIITVPVSPVDDPRELDTEGEWRRVVHAVRKQGKALSLSRVRPPTLDYLERALSGEETSIVHFMGHSDSVDGRGFLLFEEALGRSYEVDAGDFSDTLASGNIFLVVLTSCRSAVECDRTAFVNIARGLVQAGVPYAMGMQFVLPDRAASAISEALYDLLLQGSSIEEAVRRIRRTLEHNTNLQKRFWRAGIPVLYTGLRERSSPPNQKWRGACYNEPMPCRSSCRVGGW